jgi:nicotinamide mononucleotide transporter
MTERAVEPEARSLADHTLPALIVLATTGVAVAAYMTGKASLIEAIAFVSGAVCVWLVVKRSIWNFPLGLLNVFATAYVLYHGRLFADAGLQLVYFVLNVMGWWMWLKGGAQQLAVKVTDTDAKEWVGIGFFIVFATIALFYLLAWLGGAARFWDALTTAISLAAQWLLNRRKVQSWHLWILVDLIYVPLFISREFYLFALLYAIFLVMAVLGLREWQSVRERKDEAFA